MAEQTFEAVSHGIEVADELLVQLLTGPYGEDEEVHEDCDETTDRDGVKPVYGSPHGVSHSISGGNDQAVGQEDDPEAVLVRDQGRPKLHEGCNSSYVNSLQHISSYPHEIQCRVQL